MKKRINVQPLLLITLLFVILFSCTEKGGTFSKKENTGTLAIEGLTETEISQNLKRLKGVEKLIISRQAETGWQVYPPRDFDDPIFDQVPKKELSAMIGELKQLTYLSLFDLELTDLPENITNLTELDTLILGNNYLDISIELRKLNQLEKLKYLDLTNNKVDTLIVKEWIEKRPNLRVVLK